MHESKVAIVTGGGRGIGRAITLGLAQAGVAVVATAARERAELERLGDDRIVPLVADVTREDDCERTVATALESATVIWAQDLADTGVTVNTLLPGGRH